MIIIDAIVVPETIRDKNGEIFIPAGVHKVENLIEEEKNIYAFFHEFGLVDFIVLIQLYVNEMLEIILLGKDDFGTPSSSFTFCS